MRNRILFSMTILAGSLIVSRSGTPKANIGDNMETNKALARRFYEEVIDQGKIEILDSVMDPGFRDHLAPQQPPGIQGFRDFLKMVATAFPDIRVKVEDILAESDRVAVRLSITGTQTGILMGTIPPTGKPARWTGIDILRFENGKIKDRWSERNLLSMLKQLGVSN